MRTLLSNGKAACGVVMVVITVVIVMLGPLFLGDPNAFVVPLQPPSLDHWLGTTGQGQDVFTQTVAGARPTLNVAAAVGLGVTIIGAFVGRGGPRRTRGRRLVAHHQCLPSRLGFRSWW